MKAKLEQPVVGSCAGLWLVHSARGLFAQLCRSESAVMATWAWGLSGVRGGRLVITLLDPGLGFL